MPRNECIKRIVPPGSSPAAGRRGAAAVYVVRGLCGSILRRPEPWSVRAYAECLLGGPPDGVGTRVAEARPRRRKLVDCILVSHLLGLRDDPFLPAGRSLGRGQLGHAAG